MPARTTTPRDRAWPRLPHTRRERRYRAAIASAALLGTVVLAPWTYLRVTMTPDVYGPGAAPPRADVAIVLGARVYPDGTASRHLRERVETAVKLYHDGVVDTLLMTGNGLNPDGWSEPEVMRDQAVAAGVPAEDILLDGEGYDTFASCERAVAEFGVSSAVVVTQEFHVYRATWLCQRAGVDATGAFPRIGGSWGTVRGNIREVGADWKALLNIALGRGED